MHQTTEVNTGDEIININGIPVSAIVEHGYGLYCGDGYAETFKELFLSEYDGFEDACNKCYHWKGPYQIKLRTANGAIKNINMKAAEDGTIAEDPKLKPVDNFANWAVAKDIPDSRLRFFKKSSTAWFSAPPFAYADTVVYKNAFASIREKGIKNLVLDLRHNTGGDIRVATQLLSYLADSSFNIVKDVKSRVADLAQNRFSKYFDTTVTQGFVLGFKTSGKEGNWYHINATPAFGQIYGPFQLAEKDRFNGNLIVLIDGATFSSGALLTAALKAQRKNVKFIGRETAGAEEGCNGVTLQKLTLPNTKIVVDFPWMRVVSMAKNPVKGRGIVPDYVVNYKPEDVVRNNDVDLRKAMSLVK
jgi:C-terminal processing protease CtpA/Prc